MRIKIKPELFAQIPPAEPETSNVPYAWALDHSLSASARGLLMTVLTYGEGGVAVADIPSPDSLANDLRAIAELLDSGHLDVEL